jgi:hypothetical protein
LFARRCALLLRRELCAFRAIAHTHPPKGLQDQLNDLGQDGWELTAVTDAGDAKFFILKQPEQVIVDPLAQA